MKMRFDTAFTAIRSFTIAIIASSVLATAGLAESAMQPHTAEYRVKISIVGVHFGKSWLSMLSSRSRW